MTHSRRKQHSARVSSLGGTKEGKPKRPITEDEAENSNEGCKFKEYSIVKHWRRRASNIRVGLIDEFPIPLTSVAKENLPFWFGLCPGVKELKDAIKKKRVVHNLPANSDETPFVKHALYRGEDDPKGRAKTACRGG
ncbi:hypothetical protein HAX54_033686 [Datura stramonium]|uniref:Uncharacterized protein n=1 Tax=Datura stramonium TaxID=4076 RepID=A0ABS8SDI6_DATST|nr:hypothetical protein [Datura stramonium]